MAAGVGSHCFCVHLRRSLCIATKQRVRDGHGARPVRGLVGGPPWRTCVCRPRANFVFLNGWEWDFLGQTLKLPSGFSTLVAPCHVRPPRCGTVSCPTAGPSGRPCPAATLTPGVSDSPLRSQSVSRRWPRTLSIFSCGGWSLPFLLLVKHPLELLPVSGHGLLLFYCGFGRILYQFCGISALSHVRLCVVLEALACLPTFVTAFWGRGLGSR